MVSDGCGGLCEKIPPSAKFSVELTGSLLEMLSKENWGTFTKAHGLDAAPCWTGCFQNLDLWENSIWAENDRTQSRQYETPSFYPHRGGVMGEGRNKEVFGQKQPTILVHQLQIKKIKKKGRKKAQLGGGVLCTSPSVNVFLRVTGM